MARIILIETSTALCSVALSVDGEVVASREDESRAHASLTTPFVKEVLDSQGLTVASCDAVCVSMGPGSYTGLRVGVSTAKGLCFGAGLQLIAISSLETLAWQAPSIQDFCALQAPSLQSLGAEGGLGQWRYIIPMIDARRMEVYTCVYSSDIQQLTKIESKVVNSDSFASELAAGPVLFIGDGAEKCKGVIGCQSEDSVISATESTASPSLPASYSANAHFLQCCPKASSMAKAAEAAFAASRFENLAYFEPFYLKDFVATVPRRKLF